MQKVVITGGTGLVGRQLIRMLLSRGWEVLVLTRSLPHKPAEPGIRYAQWDVKKGVLDPAVFTGSTAIIHLAGAGVVEQRWSAAYKQEILDSRVKSGALLLQALRSAPHQINTFISASAIGWYGPDEEGAPAFTETAPPAGDFLGSTCRQWEASVQGATALGIRLVTLRIGIVLSGEGGALAEFKKPLRSGVAAILGSGHQVISWIQVEDLCRIFLQALENPGMEGVYNAVAPQPVSNRALTLELARQMRGNRYLPVHVPAWLLRLVMGESSIEVLKSCTVSCEKLRSTGFTFLYPAIRTALQA